MTDKAYFSPQLFDFFRDLRRNNNKPWFEANKQRYIADVRDPCIRFITDFGEHLRGISEYLLANPSTVGGSLFRIYLDVRFSRDKRPYKTAAGIQFNHVLGKKVHSPGFYLHLGPGEVFAGAGIWRPDSKAVRAVRQAIVDRPDAWRRMLAAVTESAELQFGGESLKRAPRDFDPDHPLIEDLKRKDYLLFRNFSEQQACAPDFMEVFAETCRDASPMVAFLAKALDLNY